MKVKILFKDVSDIILFNVLSIEYSKEKHFLICFWETSFGRTAYYRFEVAKIKRIYLSELKEEWKKKNLRKYRENYTL